MKQKGFGHLKTRSFTINTFKHVGFGTGMLLVVVQARAHDQPKDDVSEGWMPTAGGPRCWLVG